MQGQWIEITRAVVHPWLCDSQNHLNTRHHAALFDDASWLLLSLLGYRSEMAATERLGWADVKHVTEFKNEAPVGAFLRIDTTITKIGNSSITISHRMINSSDDTLVASFEGVSVAFDLATRKSKPVPSVMKQAAVRLFHFA